MWFVYICIAIMVLSLIGLLRALSGEKKNDAKPTTFITYDLKDKSYSVHYGMSRDGELPTFTVTRKLGGKK